MATRSREYTGAEGLGVRVGVEGDSDDESMGRDEDLPRGSRVTVFGEGRVPETPSPPRNSSHARRSSTSLGFLGTPTHPGRYFDVPNSPSSNKGRKTSISHESGSGRTRLLPPTTPKSRQTEVFMSPSPKLRSPQVSKEIEKKPIKEISNELKTRLNYALMKLQNGWVDKSLPELEHTLATDRGDGINEIGQGQNSGEVFSKLDNNDAGKDFLQQRRKSGYVNQFAGDDSSSATFKFEGLKGNTQSNDKGGDERAGTKTAIKTESNEMYSEVQSDSDENSNDEGNSAHSAFLKALSSPKKKQKSSSSTSYPVSPLRWTSTSRPKPLTLDTNLENTKKNTKGPPLEVEAIETLMSLASPKKSSGSLDEALASNDSASGRPGSVTGKGATPIFLRNDVLRQKNASNEGQLRLGNNEILAEKKSDVETEVDESD